MALAPVVFVALSGIFRHLNVANVVGLIHVAAGQRFIRNVAWCVKVTEFPVIDFTSPM